MTLRELFSFEPKTKKQLIRELSKKGMPWKRNKGNIIVDGFSIEGYQNLKLKYIVIYGKVISFQLFFNKKNNEIGQIKSSLLDIFGLPTRDNTKHKLEHVIVHWNYDNKYICLYDDSSDDTILVDYHYSTNISNNENIYSFCISMVGGIVWGILFFIFFGLGFEYSLLLFVLSMIGGLIWGLFFGLCMTKIKNYQGIKKQFVIKEKDKNIFSIYEKNNELLINGFYCIIFKWEKNKNKIYKSKIFIYDDQFILLMLDKKKVSKEIKKFKSIKRYSGDVDRGSMIIQFHDSATIHLSNLDNAEMLVKVLDNVLGYNTPRFFELKNVVFNSLVDYDPESIIAGGTPKEVFLNDAKEITIQIYGRNKIDVETIKYILEITTFNSLYSSGMDGVNFDSLTLAINIYDDLQKHNLI